MYFQFFSVRVIMRSWFTGFAINNYHRGFRVNAWLSILYKQLSEHE